MKEVKEGTLGDLFKTLFGNNDESYLNIDGLNKQDSIELKQIENYSKQGTIYLENRYGGSPTTQKGGKKGSEAKDKRTVDNQIKPEEQYVRHEGRERE